MQRPFTKREGDRVRKIMWFSLGVLCSCVTGVYLVSGKMLLWIMAISGPLAVGLLIPRKIALRILGTVFLGICLGTVWLWCFNAFYLAPVAQYDGATAKNSITVSDYSVATAYGCYADGKIDLEGRAYDVRAYFDEQIKLVPGDRVEGEFLLGLTTPGGKEESTYYQGAGVFLIAQAETECTVMSENKVHMKYFPAILRNRITHLLEETFPADALAFVRALLLGDSSLLSYETDTSLKISGIRHVIAVSGLHVSILFALVYTLLGKHRVWTAVVGIPVLVLFAAVAGFTPSIIRACIMQSLMILALLFNKEYDPPTALAFAVLVMLAANPLTVCSVSFQLSVGCMVGIFLFCEPINRHILDKLGHPTGKSIKARLARWFSSGVAVTISAMAVTTPMVAWYFGMVSLVGVVVNLLTLWCVSFIFYGVVFTCLIGMIWLPLGKAIAWVVSWPVRYVLLTAQVFSKIPVAAVYTCSIYIVFWIVISYLLFGIFLLSKKKRPLLLTACIFICLVASIAVSWAEPRKDDFRMTVFDVGEGQSVLLQSDGKYFLVDCGGNDSDRTADTVSQSLLSQGVTKLDAVILTHYDADHAGGVPGLLTRVDTKALYLPDIPASGALKESLAQLYEEKIHWVCADLCLSTNDSNITLICAPTDTDEENESSLCVLFQRENCDILLTGDRGKAGERALLESYDLPELEILIAGHHGATNSTGFELLSKTSPETVVISTGGRYGHPTKDVLQRLALFDCNILRTDIDGTMIFRR